MSWGDPIRATSVTVRSTLKWAREVAQDVLQTIHMHAVLKGESVMFIVYDSHVLLLDVQWTFLTIWHLQSYTRQRLGSLSMCKWPKTTFLALCSDANSWNNNDSVPTFIRMPSPKHFITWLKKTAREAQESLKCFCRKQLFFRILVLSEQVNTRVITHPILY